MASCEQSDSPSGMADLDLGQRTSQEGEGPREYARFMDTEMVHSAHSSLMASSGSRRSMDSGEEVDHGCSGDYPPGGPRVHDPTHTPSVAVRGAVSPGGVDGGWEWRVGMERCSGML